MRPHLREEGGVARVAEVVGDRVDELTVAVVLGNGIGAARVDAAGHFAVRELIGRVPLEKGAHFFGVAEAEQGGADHRAVADPGARVGARAGVDLRAVIVDEDVGELRAERLGDARGGAGKRDRDAVERRVPRARHVVQRTARERARVGVAREGTSDSPVFVHRHEHVDVARSRPRGSQAASSSPRTRAPFAIVHIVPSGSAPARSDSTISPSSKLETPTADGAVSGTTVHESFTRRSVSSHAMCRSGASPPCVARNCQLGFTWNGRTAR